MKTTKAERAEWKGQASEGLDVVEGVHDEIFIALIDDVDEATALLREAKAFLWGGPGGAADDSQAAARRIEDFLKEPRQSSTRGPRN